MRENDSLKVKNGMDKTECTVDPDNYKDISIPPKRGIHQNI